MLIVALVLAVIGLAALVTAVVTSNELIAWVCIGASVIGVLLLIVDALRERSRGTDGDAAEKDAATEHDDETTVIPAVGESEHDAAHQSEVTEDYPDEPVESESETAKSHAESETSTVASETHDESVASEDKRD